jgi:hypothetical protein
MGVSPRFRSVDLPRQLVVSRGVGQPLADDSPRGGGEQPNSIPLLTIAEALVGDLRPKRYDCMSHLDGYEPPDRPIPHLTFTAVGPALDDGAEPLDGATVCRIYPELSHLPPATLGILWLDYEMRVRWTQSNGPQSYDAEFIGYLFLVADGREFPEMYHDPGAELADAAAAAYGFHSTAELFAYARLRDAVYALVIGGSKAMGSPEIWAADPAELSSIAAIYGVSLLDLPRHS